MMKLLYCSILAALALVAACSSATPTPRATAVPTATSLPTATAVPPTAAPTPTPTATAVPTVAPTATSAAAVGAGAGGMAPVDMGDPEAFLGALSGVEQACLTAAGGSPLELMAMAAAGGEQPLPAGGADWIGCLGDDTLLRLFLSAMLVETGALSADSAACVRDGFAGFDLRPVMLGDADPNEAAAVGLGALLFTLSCLNDAEWEAGAAFLGLEADPELGGVVAGGREGLLCVRERLGGDAAGFAEALYAEDGGFPTGLARAAAECGATSMRQGMLGETGGIALVDMVDPQAMLASLPEAERACLEGSASPLELMMLMGSPGAAMGSAEDAAALIDCLGDETLVRVFLSGLMGGGGALSAASSDCIRAGFAVFDLREVFLSGAGAGGSDPGAALAGSMAAMSLSLACLSDADWELAALGLELDAEARDGLRCVMDELGGPEGLAETLQSPRFGGVPPAAYVAAAAACGAEAWVAPGG